MEQEILKQNKEETPVENSQETLMPNKEIKPDLLKWTIIGAIGLAAAVLIFGAGMFVGGARARFSYRWAENYHKNFAGPQGGFMGNWQGMPMMPDNFIQGHGTFGQIIEINNEGFTVKGSNDAEKLILVNQNTIIEEDGQTIGQEKLAVGDQVVIIGSPNDQGQVEAKLIRIFNGPSAQATPGPSRFPH